MATQLDARPNPDGPGLVVEINGNTFWMSHAEAWDLQWRVNRCLNGVGVAVGLDASEGGVGPVESERET